MNDLYSEKANFWKNRLNKCINEKELTQTSFAKALNSKYGTSYSQKDISRWLNIGNKIENGNIGFPKYNTMLLVADFFDVDLGYLTGETNEEKFLLDQAVSYTGLNGNAINVIKNITHPDNISSYMYKDMRNSFNEFLTAENFSVFFNCLYDLYLSTSIKSMNDEPKFDDLNSAINFKQAIEYNRKVKQYELNESLILLVNELYPEALLSDLYNE